MTFVGKVLVVVQLAMSLCFLAFAGAVYTAQTNWKKTAETNKSSLEKAQADFRKNEEDLRAQLLTARNDRDAEKLRAEGALAEADKNKKELALSRKENETLLTEVSTQRAQAQISADEATQRRDESKLRLSVNKTLHDSRNELLEQVRKLEDQNFALNVERESMIQKQEQLVEKQIGLERQLAQLGASVDTTVTASKNAPPPVVEGVVLNTRRNDRDGTEFVEISIGSDDGLAKGHDLFVYRTDGKGRFLGKLRLMYVTPDRAVGTVIDRSKNGVIQKGDNVTSKL